MNTIYIGCIKFADSALEMLHTHTSSIHCVYHPLSSHVIRKRIPSTVRIAFSFAAPFSQCLAVQRAHSTLPQRTICAPRFQVFSPSVCLCFHFRTVSKDIHLHTAKPTLDFTTAHAFLFVYTQGCRFMILFAHPNPSCNVLRLWLWSFVRLC